MTSNESVVTGTMITIMVVWGVGGGYLRYRYVQRYGRENRVRALAWGHFWGGPREGRRLQLLIWFWVLFWPILMVVLGLAVFQRHA